MSHIEPKDEVDQQNMDSSQREQLCNQLEECTETFLIHSDHSRLQALSSICSLREIPKSVVNLIVELASDASDQSHDYDHDCCLDCEERVHVPIEEMKHKRGFTTWFRIDQEFLCEQCIMYERFVCLDCKTGAFCDLPYVCDGCNEGSVCGQCCYENQDLYKFDSMTKEDQDKYTIVTEIRCLKCMDAIVGKVTKQNVQKLSSTKANRWGLSELQKRNRAKIFGDVAVKSDDSTTKKAEDIQKQNVLEQAQTSRHKVEDIVEDIEYKTSPKVNRTGSIRRSKRLQEKQSVTVHVSSPPTKRARH